MGCTKEQTTCDWKEPRVWRRKSSGTQYSLKMHLPTRSILHTMQCTVYQSHNTSTGSNVPAIAHAPSVPLTPKAYVHTLYHLRSEEQYTRRAARKRSPPFTDPLLFHNAAYTLDRFRALCETSPDHIPFRRKKKEPCYKPTIVSRQSICSKKVSGTEWQKLPSFSTLKERAYRYPSPYISH